MSAPAALRGRAAPATACQPVRRPRGRLAATRAPATQQAAATASSPSSEWSALSRIPLLRSSDGASLPITSLWGPGDKAVCIWTRSFGCPFCWELGIQANRDLRPRLEAAGARLYLISIGTLERSADYAAKTGFPRELLFADPSSASYAPLGLVKGVGATFFNPQTPLALAKRALKDGGMADLQDVLSRWEVWQTPEPSQALQQGGTFVFAGDQCVWASRDPATGVHPDVQDVLQAVGSLALVADCGCE